MASPTTYFRAQAYNNAWANHRLLKAASRLSPEELSAPRTSFFPSKPLGCYGDGGAIFTDDEALEAFQACTKLEGIIPALEPAHALAHVARLAPTLSADTLIVMNMCGRGDKDVFTVGKILGFKL